MLVVFPEFAVFLLHFFCLTYTDCAAVSLMLQPFYRFRIRFTDSAAALFSNNFEDLELIFAVLFFLF